MINFLDPHEAPTFEKVLRRMSEDGRCLLTGVKENLTYFPVDTNPQNFLPSNMACVSNDIAKDITYTFYYDKVLWGWRITFDTPPIFREYNENVFTILTGTKYQEKDKYDPKPNNMTALYEFLTKHHVKGIAKISASDDSGFEYWMDSAQYQGYLLRILAAEKAKSKSSIIKPPSLDLIK